MAEVKTVSEWMKCRSLTLEQILESGPFDPKILKAIVQDHYTPSPQQRSRLAGALGVSVDQIAWGHVEEVTHLYGHGPQFGRSP